MLIGIPPVTRPTEFIRISPIAKSRTMLTGLAHAAYHEPNQLDPVTQPDPNHHNPTNCVKGPCRSWSWAQLSWQFTLYRCCTTLPTGWWFYHPSVTKSLHFAQSTLLYVYDQQITTKSFTALPARKIFTLRFHRWGSHILHRPPLVPRLGDKITTSPKSSKSHPVLLPRIFTKLENSMLLN
jgi:hypothetical protein